jgi:regulator of protease activity HflC (stomatin/prohibitin superfamily)
MVFMLMARIRRCRSWSWSWSWTGIKSESIRQMKISLQKLSNKPAFLVLGILTALVGVFCSVYTIEQGDRGVVLRFGELSDITEPGLHFKIPLVETVQMMSVRTTKLNEKLAVYSKDAQALDVTMSVNYRANPADIDKIFTNYGLQYEQRVILPRVLAAPKDVIGRYAAVDIVQNRDELSRLILKDMQDFFLPMGIVVESINMENIDFSNTYEQSVEARMQAEVEVQKVKQNLERERLNAEIVRVSAQGEADAQVARAKAEAEATILRGEAEAKAIEARNRALAQNPNYVKLIEAERWDGKLPETMIPHQSLPILGGK